MKVPRIRIPLLEQLRHRDVQGLGQTAMSTRSLGLHARTDHDDAVVDSVCPYCAVGCAQKVHVRDGKVSHIEGNPDSPISRGHLCPKGAASMQLVTGTHRIDQVLYRPPHGTEWETLDLDTAMDMIAQRVKRVRDETWQHDDEHGHPLRRTLGMGFMGGSTLDNEECYLLAKLFGILGVPQIENQGRICHSATVPGLGTSFGRGGCTSFLQDLPNSDCVLVIGSNMAEAHPVGFQWVIEAKEAGASVIHVDPRFSRTSAHADMFVPIRVGTDIAFIGGLINYVLTNDRVFTEFVEAYTNATYLVSPDIVLPDDLDGLFSGWDPDLGEYDTTSWQYQRESGESGAIRTDPTMTDPMCVLALLKRHYARYTPEMVADVCGVPVEQFRRVAETFTEASGRERTSYICYSVGLTMHTKGVQNIRALGVLQLLLGNIGRPGGGILAVRGHANVQGATDLPILYDLLPGYLARPKAADVDRAHYLERVRPTTGWWSEYDAYLVSMLKSWFGEHATATNDFGFDLLPRITGDHSFMTQIAAMADGAIRGYFVVGENPVVSSVHGALQRKAFRQLDWLVVRDLTMIDTAEFWRSGSEYRDGQIAPEDVATEVFVLPAAAHVEKEGSFTNTGRVLQWRDRAVDPRGDCRSDLWFADQMMRRVRALYDGSDETKDRPILWANWNYPHDERGDPSAEAVLAEINGTGPDGQLLSSFRELRNDGSTSSGSWIHVGVFAEGTNQAARRVPAAEQNWVAPDWGWAWPANRRNMYNRASADPHGRPWSERKAYVWWDDEEGAWTGYDVPDFIVDRPPDYRPEAGATGLDAISGVDPFFLHPDGKGWLWSAGALRDGPLPTHYEPIESVAPNALYRQQSNPDRIEWVRDDNPYHWAYDDPRYPFVVTTYRLTETFGSGSMANRNLPWLGELQPEVFCEVSPQLAELRGLTNGDWVVLSTARADVELKVLVTRRLTPLTVTGGRTVHQIGLPYQWGPVGLLGGDNVNMLFNFSGDPNTAIEECKAITADIRPGRLDDERNVVADGELVPEPVGAAPSWDVFDGARRPTDQYGMRAARNQVGAIPGERHQVGSDQVGSDHAGVVQRGSGVTAPGHEATSASAANHMASSLTDDPAADDRRTPPQPGQRTPAEGEQ